MSVTLPSVSEELDALHSTTLKNYADKKLHDNVFRALPLWMMLKERGRIVYRTGGTKFVTHLLYGENTAGNPFRDYDVLSNTPQEGLTNAEWYWGNYAIPITISWEDEMQNSGPAQQIDLLQTKIMQAEMSIKQDLSNILHGVHGALGKTYVGGDTNTVDAMGGTSLASYDDGTGDRVRFNSLDHLIRSGWGLIDNDDSSAQSHICGGITVTNTTDGTGGDGNDWGSLTLGYLTAYVNPWWMNYSNPGLLRMTRGTEVGGTPGNIIGNTELDNAGDVDNGATLPVTAAMRNMFNRLTDGAEKPNLLLGGEEIFGVYENELAPYERFTDTKIGDAGFENLAFRTKPFIMDPGITTQIPTGANTYVPSTGAYMPTPLYFINTNFIELCIDSRANFATTEFRRPTRQMAKTAYILFRGNLAVTNRQRHGVIHFANLDDGWTA